MRRARKGAAFDLPGRGWPPGMSHGGSTRFYGGSTRWQGHRGRIWGAAAAVRGPAGRSGRLSACFPDDEAPGCGCRGPALRAARSRLTALVVSAGHMPGPAGQAGAASSCRLRNARPAALAVLAWTGDRSPVRGCTTTEGDQVLGHVKSHKCLFRGMRERHPGPACGRGGCLRWFPFLLSCVLFWCQWSWPTVTAAMAVSPVRRVRRRRRRSRRSHPASRGVLPVWLTPPWPAGSSSV